MTIDRAILSKIGQHHIGRDNAIKRKDLLNYLFEIGMIDEITEAVDRRIRAIIEEIPLICSCEDGYFLAKDAEDYNYAIKYIQKKIYPLFGKIKKKEEAYPQFSKDGQMELFNGR